MQFEAKKLNWRVEQGFLEVPAKNLLEMTRSKEVIAIGWPPTFGEFFKFRH